MQHRVHDARPRPASGVRLQVAQRVLVDLDERDVLARGLRPRRARQAPVVGLGARSICSGSDPAARSCARTARRAPARGRRGRAHGQSDQTGDRFAHDDLLVRRVAPQISNASPSRGGVGRGKHAARLRLDLRHLIVGPSGLVVKQPEMPAPHVDANSAHCRQLPWPQPVWRGSSSGVKCASRMTARRSGERRQRVVDLRRRRTRDRSRTRGRPSAPWMRYANAPPGWLSGWTRDLEAADLVSPGRDQGDRGRVGS